MTSALIGLMLIYIVFSLKAESTGKIQKTNVLIIGAGMTGIAAGYELAQNEVHDFLILESLPTIGGRIKEANVDSNTIVEFGANWIQQVTDDWVNPIYELVSCLYSFF